MLYEVITISYSPSASLLQFVVQFEHESLSRHAVIVVQNPDAGTALEDLTDTYETEIQDGIALSLIPPIEP